MGGNCLSRRSDDVLLQDDPDPGLFTWERSVEMICPADWDNYFTECGDCGKVYHQSGTVECDCAICALCDIRFHRATEDDLECQVCSEREECTKCGERFDPIGLESECLDCEE